MGSSRQSVHRAMLARTMAENGGYTYRAHLINPPVSGLLFSNTNHVVLNDVVDATGTTTPFIFGALSARNRRARDAKLVMITLPTPVPNMALLSAGDGVLRKSGFALEESQRLPLEGNFDASFRLYCPREYETDALYIFTPDLMARLIDSASGCDIEFVDNRVLIYAPPTAFTTESALARIPDLVRFLESKLHRQTLRYRDDRREATAIHDPFLRAQVTALGGSDSEYRVGLRGRRLRRRTTFVQKVGIGFALLLAAAAATYWVSAVLRAFMP